MGAAGRDFHDFQTFFRHDSAFRVCAFTATQIPFVDARFFPKSLAGPEYDDDIPVFPEARLPELIDRYDVDFVFLAYSDLSFEDVMHKASLVQSCGAAFSILGPKQTQLRSSRPVISITATRTGAGKSPIAQWLARYLVEQQLTVGVIRHPMPYGDLSKQAVQRFASVEDLDRHDCTVEEREEYEPYVEGSMTIFAGVDYAAVLSAAEQEAQVILWDGGNNDYSFIRPSLSIVVADALRAGHGTQFYPGETNLRSADVVVINKVDQADVADVKMIRQTVRQLNPSAQLVTGQLLIDVENAESIRDRKVLVIEDGPTLTHGGMAFGAGSVAACRFHAAEQIDPRPHAVDSIAQVFRDYPHLSAVLPAIGYSEEQRDALKRTIEACQPEMIIDASPANLSRWLAPDIPVHRVRYRFQQLSGEPLEQLAINTIKSSGE